MCGENMQVLEVLLALLGSSPHVRGKPYEIAQRGSVTGLIPACAGKTFLFVFVYGYVGAHPRMCGENLSSKEIKT